MNEYMMGYFGLVFRVTRLIAMVSKTDALVLLLMNLPLTWLTLK
jgi:hypothetical protein